MYPEQPSNGIQLLREARDSTSTSSEAAVDASHRYSSTALPELREDLRQRYRFDIILHATLELTLSRRLHCLLENIHNAHLSRRGRLQNINIRTFNDADRYIYY